MSSLDPLFSVHAGFKLSSSGLEACTAFAAPMRSVSAAHRKQPIVVHCLRDISVVVSNKPRDSAGYPLLLL